jgi:hypothetical protein
MKSIPRRARLLKPLTLCLLFLTILGVVYGGGRRAPDHDAPRQRPSVAALADPALHDELLSMMSRDQAARQPLQHGNHAGSDALATLAAVDAADTARMKVIVAEHGWPTRSMVGADGEDAAWLLVQHADADAVFQRGCLVLLSAAVRDGEARPSHIAYLTDRVAVADHKPQTYGTQFVGREPYPIADAEHVDERRGAVGLSSMADYRKAMDAAYGAK